MGFCDLPDKEFKIVVLLRKFNEPKENTEGQPNKIRKIIPKQNEIFNRHRNHKKEHKRKAGAEELTG